MHPWLLFSMLSFKRVMPVRSGLLMLAPREMRYVAVLRLFVNAEQVRAVEW